MNSNVNSSVNSSVASSGLPSISTKARRVQIAVYVLFLLIVIFAIWTLHKSKTMTVTAKLLLGNLMSAHVCYWLIALFRILFGQYLTSTGCKVFIYTSVAHLYGTVFSVVFVTGDRFIATRFPFRHINIHVAHITACLACSWVASGFFSLCTFYGGLTDHNACHPWFSLPVYGLCVYGTTVVCSTLFVWAASAYIYKEVCRHMRSIENMTCTQTNTLPVLSIFARKQMETTVTFVLIAMSQTVMSFPIVVIFPLMNSGGQDERTMMILLLVFGLSSRVVDPFIYIFRQRLLKNCQRAK